MTQENGDRPESLGLWPDDEQPIPLLTPEQPSPQPTDEGETLQSSRASRREPASCGGEAEVVRAGRR